jgi:3-oxoacyl-[acyl-carrier-protein] synthase-1
MSVSLPSPVFGLIGVGAVTAVGHSARQSAASWLAHARAMQRLRLPELAEPVTIVPCTSVTGQLQDTARLQAMLPSAIAEALAGFTPQRDARNADQPQVLEILLLPSELDQAQCQAMHATLDQTLTHFPAWQAMANLRSHCQRGSVSAWEALEMAFRTLASHPGIDYVLIAGADSLCNPPQLARAAKQGLLQHKGNREGYVAGEAAACVLLQRMNNVLHLAPGQFALHRPGVVHSSDAPALATNLATALNSAMANAGMNGSHISHLASDMDGSSWRAHLESPALANSVYRETSGLPQWYLAEMLGQTGAVTGLLNWIMASQLQQVERINTVLNWAIDSSSQSAGQGAGHCAANVLERAP